MKHVTRDPVLGDPMQAHELNPSSNKMKIRIEVSQDSAEVLNDTHQSIGQTDEQRPASRSKNRTALLKKNPLDINSDAKQQIDPKFFLNMDLREIRDLKNDSMLVHQPQTT